jgi:hypothetical protein
VAQTFQWFGKSASPESNQGSASPESSPASCDTSPGRGQHPDCSFSNHIGQTARASAPQSAGRSRLNHRSRRFAKMFVAALVCTAQTLAAHADNSHVFTSAKESVSDAADAANAARKPVRTWLDPLRQPRSRKSDAPNAGEQSGLNTTAGDFDLSDYSEAPNAKHRW